MPQPSQPKQLSELIHREKDSILAAWRNQVRALPSARHLDIPTLNDHVPTLLDEISAGLRVGSDETIAEALIQESPPAHGLQRLKDGFDIEEVVAEYNILRGTIHSFAEQHDLIMQGEAFHILNRVLDEAIGKAVQTYAAERAREIQQRRDEYLAFVVHDLRTPLNAVSLAAKMLEIHTADSPTETKTQLFTILGRNLSQLETLIGAIVEESVQTLSGEVQQPVPRHFDLWPLVERLGEDLRSSLEQSGTKYVNLVPPNLMVLADAQMVKRIFQNLVGNAIRYTPAGLIEVGAERDLTSGCVECWVKDNGAGIPEDRISKVFDKLESDPDNEEGVGLGLAIVKSFVELHGGTVTVESTLGAGSTFRFTIPPRT